MKDFASGCIVQVVAIVSCCFFMGHKDLQTWTIRDEFSEMDSIAMAEACGAEQLAIVIDGGRTHHNLIEPVVIDVANRDAVNSLSVGRLAGARCCHVAAAIDDIPSGCRMSAVEPAGGEVGAVPIDSPEIGLGIVAALHYDGGKMIKSVKVCYAGIVAFATVVVGLLAHNGFPSAICTCLSSFHSSVRIVPDGLQSATRFATEDGEELFSIYDMSIAVAEVLLVGCDAGDTVVDADFTHICPAGILGAWSSFYHEFCLSVAIEIIDEERGVMCTCTDVLSHVDAPKLLADPFTYDFVAVEEGIASVTGLGVVLRIGRIPFDNDLVFTISINIAHRAIIGSVGETTACCVSALRAIEFHLSQRSLRIGLQTGLVFLDDPILEDR